MYRQKNLVNTLKGGYPPLGVNSKENLLLIENSTSQPAPRRFQQAAPLRDGYLSWIS